MKAGQVPRIGDQDDVGADLHEHEVRCQRVDVVQRQRKDGRLLAVLQIAGDPRVHLLQIGHQVAVSQDGTLRHTGRAAGVLQERDVVMVERHVVEHLRSPGPQGGLELDRVRNVPMRHHLLHVLHDDSW